MYIVSTDSDTDEETDRLLQKQYQRRDQYVAIPELDSEASQQKAKVRTVLVLLLMLQFSKDQFSEFSLSLGRSPYYAYCY